VAYEQGEELRISGWSSRTRLRQGSKHLCGQTCLHKLVDDFMARSIAVRAHAAAADVQGGVSTDTSLTSNAAHLEAESSARLLTPSMPALPKPPFGAQVELVTQPGRLQPREFAAAGGPTRYASRNWQSEAWERERERELRTVERGPDLAASRRSSA
jgi:hypothetical protein